jgi:hypothetical protein
MLKTALACVLLGAFGCDGSTAASPFPSNSPAPPLTTARPDSGLPPQEGIIDDGTGPSNTTDPTLGGRCADDEQCDDGIECTFDQCDPVLERCRSVPDDRSCQDDNYCNGVEVCSPTRGCRPGDVVTCDDKTACTIDRCIEDEQSCLHEPRDGDRDGDLDAHCVDERGDCDDTNPFISSLVLEVCGNGIDDNCDLETDELICHAPEFDECSLALELRENGTTLLSLQSASNDVAASCGFEAARDVFVVVIVEGEPKDVLLTATAGTGTVALAAFDDCDTSMELGCESASSTPPELPEARLLLRNASEGRYPVAVLVDLSPNVELRVEFGQATSDPGGETCGDARPLVPGEPLEVDLFGALPDEVSACLTGQGDRVFSFSVDEPSDARIYAASTDGASEPMLSLRGPDCGEEISCVTAEPSELFARGLAQGEYSVVVAAEPPGRVSLLVELDSETPAPSGDACDAPPVLVPGRALDLDLDDFTDDVSLGCLPNARDAVLRLPLDGPSDVLLMLRLSSYDTGAIGLAPAAECTSRAALGCSVGDVSPLRLVEHRLLPGEYDVVVESSLGSPAELFSFVRPATSPIAATAAEDCDTAIVIPEGGGSFEGNSSSAVAHFSASCDVGGISEFGAADHLLRLTLSQRRRVLFDMAGTAFPAVVSVRQGPECPGSELGCSAALDGAALLDLVLDPGDYFVQIDGYAGSEGQWFIEVFETDP